MRSMYTINYNPPKVEKFIISDFHFHWVATLQTWMIISSNRVINSLLFFYVLYV